MAKDNMIAKGVRMPQEMWDMCDTMTEKNSESSRNEFIRRAVEFYIEYKNHERHVEFLTPALESVIDGKIKDSEDRIARIIFKLAVDQNFLAHLIGNQYDYGNTRKSVCNSARKKETGARHTRCIRRTVTENFLAGPDSQNGICGARPNSVFIRRSIGYWWN